MQGHYDVINLGVHNYNAVDYSRMALWAKRELGPSHLFIGLFVGNDVFSYNRVAYAPRGIETIPRALWSSSFLLNWISYARELESPTSGPPPEVTPVASEPAAVALTDGSADESVRLSGEAADEFDFFDDFSDPGCRTKNHDRYVKDYIQFRKTPGKARLYSNPSITYNFSRSTVAVLKNLRDQLSETKLHVFIFPERLQMSDREWEWLSTKFPDLYNLRSQMSSRLAADLELHGIPFIDMSRYLDETCYLRFDGHFSEEGHRRVANQALIALGVR